MKTMLNREEICTAQASVFTSGALIQGDHSRIQFS